MTIALCMSCGKTKWGAWCACDECGDEPPRGDALSLAFTDHNFHPKTLEQFGEVFQEIASLSPDSQHARVAFCYHISCNYPGIIEVKLPPERTRVIESLLAACTLREVTIQKLPQPEQEGT